MSYQVLARKYRPQRFADMVGQDAVVRTLTNALRAGRVHHAYAFSGIRGIGKTTSARLLARALNCAAGPTPDPCGACPACVEIAAGRSLDALEIDAASNRGIDEVKSLVQGTQYAPSRDRHKIYIVDEFHMLTREAFNALLKTLEEPPPRVVFILATTEIEKVPATILSRCLLVPFRRVSTAELREHLLDVARRENVRLDEGAADLLARKAGGSVRDAQSAFDRVLALADGEVTRQVASEVLGVVDAAVLRGMLKSVLQGDVGAALEAALAVLRAGADVQGACDDLLAEARGLLVCRVASDPAAVLGLPAAEVADLASVAALGSPEDLRRIVDRLMDAGPRLRQASDAGVAFEALVVRLAHLVRLEPLEELVRRLATGRADEGSEPPPAGDRPRLDPEAAVATAARGAAPAAPPRPAAGWRERARSETSAAAPSSAPPGAPRGPAAPPRAVKRVHAPALGAGPLERFRSGLAPRLRAHVDEGVLRLDGDGLTLVLPGDREAAATALEADRFHVMGAAGEAFGRPAPVRVVVDASLAGAAEVPGDLTGAALASRRLEERARESPAVRAVVSRFAAKVKDVVPEDRDAST